MGKLVYVDGQPVARGTAQAFYKLRAAFKKATGYNLLVTSGYRSYAQQKDLYDRWTGRPGGPIKRPPFYSPSVAKPGTSRHESGRALDLRDSGNSPGVTVAGNKRSNWIKANAAKYGFRANGYSFREPWHFEYQGDPWASTSTTTSTPSRLSVDGHFGPASTRKLQSLLKTTQDGNFSGQSSASRKYHVRMNTMRYGGGGSTAIRALQKRLGTTADGLFGPNTIKALQRKLKVSADGYAGNNTVKAWQRKLNAGKVF